jgi:hypothetical protein
MWQSGKSFKGGLKDKQDGGGPKNTFLLFIIQPLRINCILGDSILTRLDFFQ